MNADYNRRYRAISAVKAMLEKHGPSCENFITQFVASSQVFSAPYNTRKEEISARVTKLLPDSGSSNASDWSKYMERLSNIFQDSFLGKVYEDDVIVLDHLEIILDAVEDYAANKNA